MRSKLLALPLCLATLGLSCLRDGPPAEAPRRPTPPAPSRPEVPAASGAPSEVPATSRAATSGATSRACLEVPATSGATSRACPEVPATSGASSGACLEVPATSGSATSGSTRAPGGTCEARIAEADLAPVDGATLAALSELPSVVVSVEVVPALYLRPPAAARSDRAAEIRASLEASRRPRRAVRELLRARGSDRPLLREILLTDGYLYAERSGLAVALVQEATLEALFDEPEIARLRGGRVERLRRTGEGYVDAAGERATLLLNDRVSTDPSTLEPALHLDLEAVRRETGALRTLPSGLRGRAVALDLVFPDGSRRPALIEAGAAAEPRLRCIGGDEATLSATLADAARFWARHRALVEAAERAVAERPRFDEPIGEPEGVQEDGRLRLAWREAYLRGRATFTYREVDYPVFDRTGAAIPPQVCVDMLFDTWERAAGTWYRPRGAEPGRTRGALDFSEVPGLSRRSLAAVLERAAEPGSPFERYDVPREDRAPPRSGEAFGQALARWADQVREGDGLVIHGIREQDMREHYHSVLVLRTEPVSGVPMVVADNQGHPRIGSVARAMAAAPRRTVNHRLRVALHGGSPSGA